MRVSRARRAASFLALSITLAADVAHAQATQAAQATDDADGGASPTTDAAPATATAPATDPAAATAAASAAAPDGTASDPGPPLASKVKVPPDPEGAPARRLEWNPRWTKFQPAEYVATAAVNAAVVAFYLAGKPATEPNWVGPILFDKPIRNGLRVHGRDALSKARLVSDIFYISPIVYAFADSLLTPTFKGKADIGWQLFMMDAEAYALTGLFLYTMFETVGRARPAYLECKAGGSDDPLCNAGSFTSFPSGHTAGAFTAAGLTCAHHQKLALYGGGVGDVLACVGSLTFATTTGVFRLIGDRHYATDVLVGGGMGFLIGYGLPMLLHYRERPIGEVHRSATMRMGITPGAGVTPLGLSAFGLF